MLEPQLLEPQLPEPRAETSAANAAPIRLLDTQARGHIGRRLLYQQPSGELTEDPMWRWSSAPDRYLDTALRLELASSPGLRLVDAASAPALAANACWPGTSSLQAGHDWSAQSSSSSRGPTASSIRYMVRASEPVSAELPGDLAAAAGRLLRRLASEGLTHVPRER